jgi:hypothetical protein
MQFFLKTNIKIITIYSGQPKVLHILSNQLQNSHNRIMIESNDIYCDPNYVLKGGYIKDLFDFLRQIV